MTSLWTEGPQPRMGDRYDYCCGLQRGVGGRNLTDESYLEQVTDFSDIGYVSARRNEPRTYGAELVYRFQ